MTTISIKSLTLEGILKLSCKHWFRRLPRLLLSVLLLERGKAKKLIPQKFLSLLLFTLDGYTVLTCASSMEKMMMASSAGIISSGIIGLPTNG